MAEEMFRAPIHRGMRTLDRSKFQKTALLNAARVFDNKNISKLRAALERSKDALQQDRLGSLHADPDPERAKAGK
ncbi:tRNA(m(1)G37)methyltransferase, partial [Friedmanniomyces endolithicus]